MTRRFDQQPRRRRRAGDFVIVMLEYARASARAAGLSVSIAWTNATTMTEREEGARRASYFLTDDASFPTRETSSSSTAAAARTTVMRHFGGKMFFPPDCVPPPPYFRAVATMGSLSLSLSSLLFSRHFHAFKPVCHLQWTNNGFIRLRLGGRTD